MPSRVARVPPVFVGGCRGEQRSRWTCTPQRHNDWRPPSLSIFFMKTMRTNPVGITGVGAMTPLGSDFATFSENLLAGRSAVKSLTDTRAGVDVRLPFSASEDPPIAAGWDEATFRALPRTEQFV